MPDHPLGDVLVPAPFGDEVGVTLEATRVRTTERITALARDFASVVASCEAAAYDDEHDPEGHTIAFERQQVAGLLAGAKAHLAEVHAAIDRLAHGTYGTCGSCRAPVAPARLRAEPTARTCVRCATAAPPGLFS